MYLYLSSSYLNSDGKTLFWFLFLVAYVTKLLIIRGGLMKTESTYAATNYFC